MDKNKNLLFGAIAAIAVMCVAVALLVNRGGQAEKNKEAIKIGVILPLTGELSSYGVAMKSAIQMAYNEIDSSEYELLFIDSKAENKEAVSGLNKLIHTDNVKYVIGDVSSSTTMALVRVAEQNQIFLLSPGAVTPELRNISKYFARNYPATDEESISAANFICSNYDKNNIAVIYSNDEYGLGLSTILINEVKKLGGKIIVSDSYEPGTRDFRTILEKIRNAKPAIIYLAGNQREMGHFMRQYQELGIKSQIVSNISFLEDDCLSVAGDAANGVVVPVAHYDPTDATYKAAYQFGESFEKNFGKPPTVVDAIGYDAFKLMVQAIRNSQTPLDAAAYVRNFKNYDGALGVLNFTDGDVSMPIVFKIIEDGKPTDLQTNH